MRPAGVQVSVIVSVQEPHMIVTFSLWWNKEEIILELLNYPPKKKIHNAVPYADCGEMFIIVWECESGFL